MENREKKYISAVVYVHNAEERIARFLSMLIRILESHFEYSEIICVNDASEDGSHQAICDAGRLSSDTSVTILNMSYYHGLEFAMNAGMDLSVGDFVFEFDHTEVDYDEGLVMELYQHALKGYDIVSASPDKKEKATSRLFYQVFDRFTNLSYRMETESFRILSRRVINRIKSMNTAILYRKAIYANCGLKTDNIRYPVTQGQEALPVDKKERRYRTRLAADSLILFTELGYRFSMVMTMAMMLVSVFMIAYTVVAYFTLHPVAGWTTTILFLSVSFFGLFGILTVIVKYLQLLVDMVYKRKHYSFESIEKIS